MSASHLARSSRHEPEFIKGREEPVAFRPDFGQRFLVTVDVEEEFDWSAPISRDGYRLDDYAAILDFQRLAEAFGVVPAYLIDWPICDHKQAMDIYAGLHREGRAEIGLQMHPWVNPPFEEEINTYNSFPCNLPHPLEQEKITRLAQALQRSTGKMPRIFRAGRYGYRRHSSAHYPSGDDLVFDSSVRSLFSYAEQGGPDFSKAPVKPFWIDREKGIVELPLTTSWWGIMRNIGPLLYPLMESIPKARALAARFGLLERIALTPEGVNAEDAIRAIDIALDDGLPLINISFHSPSLRPGNTPYARNEQEAAGLLDWWERILTYLKMRNIAPASVDEIAEAIIR